MQVINIPGIPSLSLLFGVVHFSSAGKSPLRTYSRTNKRSGSATGASAGVSAFAAAALTLSAGLSDNIHIGLLPKKPVRSHFAFALE